jgi:hypothetical protein
MQGAAKFHASFQGSAIQTEFRILRALARVMRDSLDQPASITAFEESGLSANYVVAHLGSIAAAHMTEGIEDVSAITGIWDAYFASPKIRYAHDACRATLEAARARSLVEVNREDSLSDLTAANKSAYGLVKDTLAKYGFGKLMPGTPACMEIFYDPAATHFCAGSIRMAQQIRWAHQPVSHALEGLLISDLILAHEYLSHMAPLNSYLDQTVREAWLVGALRETLHITRGIQAWKRVLWIQYRSDLSQHILKIQQAHPDVASAVRLEGLLGVEEQVIRLHAKNTAVFWRLTGEILEQPDDPETAQEITWLLNELVTMGGQGIALVISLNKMTLQNLLDRIRSLG